jgi:hypothetical protein
MPILIRDKRVLLSEARENFEDDMTWDRVGLDEVSRNDDLQNRADVQAAIMLHETLVDYCGGWPNTFG